MPEFGNTALGLVTLFGGLVGECEINSLGIKITCTGSNVQLEQNMPRRTYQASCMHTLYDAQCTLVQTAFTDGFVVASANAIAINWVTAPPDPSRYLYGTMTVTSGAGEGQAITVANYSPAGVVFEHGNRRIRRCRIGAGIFRRAGADQILMVEERAAECALKKIIGKHEFPGQGVQR